MLFDGQCTDRRLLCDSARGLRDGVCIISGRESVRPCLPLVNERRSQRLVARKKKAFYKPFLLPRLNLWRRQPGFILATHSTLPSHQTSLSSRTLFLRCKRLCPTLPLLAPCAWATGFKVPAYFSNTNHLRACNNPPTRWPFLPRFSRSFPSTSSRFPCHPMCLGNRF